MLCPICKSSEILETALHVDGFHENLLECCCCGGSWSINHGKAEMFRDPQEKSFLEGITECVEGDDYGWAA